MRIAALIFISLCSLAQRPASAADTPWQVDGLDHIMLWTDNIDRTTSVLAVKLGFQVRPGGDFGDGVANRVLRLGDESYLELLYTTRPRAELTDDTRKQLDKLRAPTGARTFGIHPSDVDKLDAHLRKQGFVLDPPSPLTYDPDGAGPLEKLGFVYRGSIDLPQVNANGVRLEAGQDTLLLLAPKGEGVAAKALATRGTHILGLSLGVEDIDRAQRLVRRGYGVKLEHYAGLERDSILAPTYDDLGLLIEFHAFR